jgi:hypothetical protein
VKEWAKRKGREVEVGTIPAHTLPCHDPTASFDLYPFQRLLAVPWPGAVVIPVCGHIRPESKLLAKGAPFTSMDIYAARWQKVAERAGQESSRQMCLNRVPLLPLLDRPGTWDFAYKL